MTYRTASLLLVALPSLLATPGLRGQVGLHVEFGVGALRRPRVHVSLGATVPYRARQLHRCGRRHGHAVYGVCPTPPPRCAAHRPAVSYKKVWVPPVYRNVYAGRDTCGRPVYRRVCVAAGYYRSVPVARTCSRCGVGLSGGAVVHR